jgi:hypothetical protein
LSDPLFFFINHLAPITRMISSLRFDLYSAQSDSTGGQPFQLAAGM